MDTTIIIRDEKVIGAGIAIKANVGFDVDEPYGDGLIAEIDEIMIDYVSCDGVKFDGDAIYEADLIDYICDLVTDWVECNPEAWTEKVNNLLGEERCRFYDW